MSLNNYPLIFLDNGFINVTSVDFFVEVWVSGLSVANCVLYLVAFSIFYAVVIGLTCRVIKTHSTVLKRNPRILITLVVVFVGIQCANLVSRLIAECLYIGARTSVERGELLSYSYFIAINVMTTLTTFLMFFNYAFFFIIVFFVQQLL